jgi:hypothetical protein
MIIASEDVMYEKTIGWLINFGTGFRYLQDATPKSKIKGDGFIVSSISRFLERVDELGFTVTRRAAHRLVAFKDDIENSSEIKLSTEQAKQLRAIIRQLRPTLFAEANGTLAYIISERRYPVEKLLDDPGALFAADVFPALPELAQYDFGEGAKCLAFERPTAAAFHVLRATEAIPVHYYRQKVKQKRVQLMWGPIIASMRTKQKRFPEALLNHLDNIRVSFRNPTAHPEKTYDLDESQDLFSICIDVANRMVLDLKRDAEAKNTKGS